MEKQKDTLYVLNLITTPAFLVQEGHIAQLNTAAAQIMLEAGTSIEALLPDHLAELEGLQDGCIYLTLQHAEQMLGATAIPVNDGLLFVLSSEADQAELRALALTAAGMRFPLAEMSQSANNLKSVVESTGQSDALVPLAQLNKQIYQLQRIIGNMSDAAQYATGRRGHFSVRDITALVAEYFDHAKTLLAHSNLKLNYQLPSESILGLIDADLLERAVYNMLSNAAKFSKEGDTIHAGLSRKGQRLQLWVEDTGCGIPKPVLDTVFTRYQRTPGIEEKRQGLGLGMVMIRAAANTHRGTVLIVPTQSGTKIVLSFPIDQGRNAPLRSPSIPFDYAGERDHALIELADVLPASLYTDAF
jgi:signal transduction histidine kinase